MENIISKIKLFIFNNGPCKIFQSDKGTEFTNKELKVYLENQNIMQVFSRVRNPQTNGVVEAFHNTVRKYLLNELKIKHKKFNIDYSIAEFIIFYNNSIHGATKKTPVDIKDCTDEDIINEVNLNIIKSMSYKINRDSNINKDYPLLLCDNIKVSFEKIISINNKKHKKIIIIPCRFCSFANNDLVNIIIDINYENLLKKI